MEVPQLPGEGPEGLQSEYSQATVRVQSGYSQRTVSVQSAYSQDFRVCAGVIYRVIKVTNY